MDGLSYTNWKRRTGFTGRGTTAQIVERWLRLAWNQQQECSLGWGPNSEGEHGSMSANGIGAFVLRKGLRPAMLAVRRSPPTSQEIEGMFAKPVLREGPPRTGRGNGA